jgi:hypothetical protein
MPSNKDEPKEIESEFVARASEELEDAVAEELEVEDPSVEEAAAIIAELSIEIPVVEEAAGDVEEDVEDVEEVVDPPVRNRGPQ